ncbi:two-component sensor histidine kinase [Streptomyces sp. F63]|uniref:sensor histidine kinase n=1 Tax=Streptomyces sp. F63 TaxID=2824887 RepID=UPI001B3789D8|nr:histidine kinase [Streptomyces sp. F63]MBQ0984032.1 two-component sensor histidine kinase [Streptomyces sp. F63]
MPSAVPLPRRDDALMAAGGLLGGLLLWHFDLRTTVPHGADPGLLPLAPLAVMCGAVLLRRTGRPWTLLVAVGALVADQLIGSLLATVLMFTDVVYASVLYGRPAMARRVPALSTVATVGVTLSALAARPEPESLLVGVVCALITVVPAWSGLTVREHRETARAERLRAEQTALLSEMDRREAVAAERGRMARELHDLVANRLSAIALHSTAALSLGDRESAGESLRVIRENSVQGLAEMRGLIGLLRTGEGEDAGLLAAPRLDGLGALLEQTRANGAGTGLEFVLEDTRTPGPRLPAPVEMAAYRIVQESLTNTLKHASPGTVTVTLALEDGGPLTVEVRSPCAGGGRPLAPGAGAGLVGMEERVALLGGTFEAGPVDGPAGTGAAPDTEERTGTGPGRARTWQVRAALPADVRGA